MKIIKKREAKARGLKFYFTGKPCIRGNIAKRLVSSGLCWCVDCRAKYKEKNCKCSRRWNHEHPERVRDNRRKRYAANPEKIKEYRERNKEKMKEYAKEYRKAHKERLDEQKRKWYVENKEKHRKSCHEWEKNNPEKLYQYQVLRRSRKKGAAGSHTLAEWKMLKLLHGNKCAICGKDKKLSRDHIIPLTRRGSNYIENIQPLCHSCNSKKHTKLMDELCK